MKATAERARHRPIEPGLAVLHANRLETLRTLTVDWLRQTPLAPLEDEIFLVQSNGMAQWLKLALASPVDNPAGGCGIAAAHRFVLPQSFLWRAYRAVLGEHEVPETSPFEKTRLQWRIYKLLPQVIDQAPDVYAPLRRFLSNDLGARKRHQLARRLADLFDQYQVYRADWLQDWINGDDLLRTARGQADRLGEDLRWQADLWRRVHADIGDPAQRLSRPGIQQRFIAALDTAEPGSFATLPRRLIVFGITSLPQPVLQALHALSRHCQILQLVQNPSAHFWADLVEDRELLKLDQQRHQQKSGTAGHPLLAAWGKQGRDFIGLLYDYDQPERYRDWFQEIDVFEAPIGDAESVEAAPVLQQIQQDVFALTPLPGPDNRRPLDGDRSIRFHRTHSRQREVEILHDRLLDAFARADAGDRPLRPRDIIVMVPDIDAYAPAVEAVFGTIEDRDPRYVPYTIGDRRSRSETPLAVALERLSDLPNARLTLSDVLDLLEVAPFRRRFGLREEDLPTLRRWCRDAGIRWGLNAGQRQALGVNADFDANSWRFGLRRMLLGYASGTAGAWADIEPYPEIGGIDAALLGPLRTLLDTLEKHCEQLRYAGTPAQWGQRLEALLADCFELHEAEELQLESRLLSHLGDWLTACDDAGLAEPLPLSVARESWLAALDDEGPAQRFLAGRVNICTMMPMRSIPFRMVCLLGMNDGDYPRTQPPLDFDLMARRGQYRPGDRSRRDDDRYLFLEALLAARETLHISWIGRNPRDNEPLPPSVLVSQLRDHLDRGWWAVDAQGNDSSVSEALTVDHPLQPFSPHYDNTGERFTYASEWEPSAITTAAHEPMLAPAVFDEPPVLSLTDISQFLRDACGHFLRERLKLRFDLGTAAAAEHEPFDLAGLDAYGVDEALLTAAHQAETADAKTAITAAGERLLRAGRLPVAALGELSLNAARQRAVTAAQHWQQAKETWPHAEAPRELQLRRTILGQSIHIEDWISDIHSDGLNNHARLVLKAGDTLKERKPHYPRLLDDWLRHLALNAAGRPVETRIIAHDGCRTLRPVAADEANAQLSSILEGWLCGLQQPLPLPIRTAFAYLAKKPAQPPNPRDLAPQYEGNQKQTGEVDYDSNGALRRCYPSAAALLAPQHDGQSQFAYWSEQLFQPLCDALAEEKNR